MLMMLAGIDKCFLAGPRRGLIGLDSARISWQIKADSIESGVIARCIQTK